MPTSISLWLYIPLMSATAVGLVNAVNMADGQNGVVGGLFAVWAACLLSVDTGAVAAIGGAILTLSLVFLAFNLSGRIFLGDCGSYGVTFVLGLLVTYAHAQGKLSLDTIIVWFFIPVMDCIRLLVSRPLRGCSPFEGDRDHFHHRLQDRVGKTMGFVTYVGTVGLSSAVATIAPRFALVCLCALCAFYFSFAWLTDANTAAQSGESQDEKVVSIGDGNRRHHSS
jgi:UDP-GlcNAc:undecaprenyl-phosphate GlcNAc-1-phosphate transferase